MKISDEMCLALQDYFLRRAGYISHEFDPDVHRFTRELDKYVKDNIIKEENKEYDEYTRNFPLNDPRD